MTPQSTRNQESSGTSGSSSDPSKEKSFQISPPSISLPKGGGAIRGMGEKFAANPVTGTGSMSVPIATSPGRSGFGPQLSLSYDSGSGNGPCGFGWTLSLPSITRKTDKGLPRYLDQQDSDVFILSGAEDLVPVMVNRNGAWERERLDPITVGGATYQIQRYRPRIEGLFARIERWSNTQKTEDVFWRSISKDNVTTWYGKSDNSRIADPRDKSHIFSWLICQSYDDKGNVVVYQYKAEDSRNVDVTQVHERNRTSDNRVRGDEYKANRTANRYLKRVCYGNREPYLPKLTSTDWPQPPDPTASSNRPNYLFEVVFDYGDHDPAKATTRDDQATDAAGLLRYPWPARVDPFSTYRAGFEVRTYRLCQRVLMFHHFPDELGTADYLVRSTDFTYSFGSDPADPRTPIYSFMNSVSQSGYVRQANGSYLKKSLPPLQFEYTQAKIQTEVHEIDPQSLANLPYGLDGSKYQWVDLDGEGLSGILTEQGDGWFYKRNLSALPDGPQDSQKVLARFAPVELVAKKPSLATLGGGQQFIDLAGDGQQDLVSFGGATPGFFGRTADEDWQQFKTFRSLPNIDWSNANLKFVDLTGDGHADILVTEDEVFWWHPSLAEEGFGPAERVPQDWDEEKGPRLVFADAEHSIFLADLSGDGLSDLVRIRNGEVCYWPNLGYGRFGAKVSMDQAPWFDHPDQFEPRRIQLADIDGSGTSDIIYLGRAGIDVYFNQSGNSWGDAQRLPAFPQCDNLSSVTVVDLLGNGTACLVWSSPLAENTRRPMRYIELMGEQKPHLLVKTINNLGCETTVKYAPSTQFYLQDKLAGQPWATKIPFPVHVVERVTVYDKWRRTHFTTTYSYHHGYYDGFEREFRGFGRVEQVDCEDFGPFSQANSDSPFITQDQTLYQPPVKTITWYHTGAAVDRQRILTQFQAEYFPNALAAVPTSFDIGSGFTEKALPEPELELQDLSAVEWREALRACKGMTLRQEIYELDVKSLQPYNDRKPRHIPVRLFSTATHNCNIRCLQPSGNNPHAVFLVTESEALTYHYELELRPVMAVQGASSRATLVPDPRIAHTLNLTFDEYGNVLQSVAAAYPRVPTLDFTSQVIQDQPVAYFRFGEAAGSGEVQDFSGNNNRGTVSPVGVTLGVLGFVSPNTAARFDGQGSGRVKVPDSEKLNPQHITMEAVVSWAGANGFQQRIVEKSYSSGQPTVPTYGLNILDDGRLHAEIMVNGHANASELNSKAKIIANIPSHVAATYDGKSICLYINGIFDNSLEVAGELYSSYRASDLGIGNQVNRDRPFNGLIDELAVYDKALSAARLRVHAAVLDRGAANQFDLIEEVQRERHLAYSETRYTTDAILSVNPSLPVEHHRLRVPCEVRTYELTGFVPSDGFYFSSADLKAYRLSETLPNQGTKAVRRNGYHEVPQDTAPTKRLVEHVRTLFFDDDASSRGFLKERLPLGTLGKLGLVYEQYKLAITDALLDAIFTEGQLARRVPVEIFPGNSTVRSALNDWHRSGYLSGAAASAKFGTTAAGEYWIRSGIAGFASDAAQHFFLPEQYTDPFDNVTTLEYGKYDLFIQSSTDALGNRSGIFVDGGSPRFDYRALAPTEVYDINGNRSEVYFDALGMVIATAVKGKGTEADNLNGYSDAFANPNLADTLNYFDLEPSTADQLRDKFSPLLANATGRFLYHFGAERDGAGQPIWNSRPAGACAVVRERHVASLANGASPSPLQVAFECSDGMGTVLMKRSQAEPEQEGGQVRWIVSGKTVLNNKGKPVKQYEPYFSNNPSCCAEGDEHDEVGVTPLMYYDAPGRLIRTEMPDGSLTRVEFSPWYSRSFDQNDTILEANNRWYGTRMAATALAEDKRAAALAATHAWTPAESHFDSLGRDVVSIAHNRVAENNVWRDEKYLTYTKLDAEGKPLWIRDALGHLVMQYLWPIKPANDNPRVVRDVDPNGNANNDIGARVPTYDIAGNLLFQHSMDAGNRWMINDAAGKPLFAWDFNERQLVDQSLVNEPRYYATTYDSLHRPTAMWLQVANDAPLMIERFEYQDGQVDDPVNLNGQLVRHYNPSGLTETMRRDFNGNELEVKRRLNNQPTESAIDWQADPAGKLESEAFYQITEYDALKRMTKHFNWHRGNASRVAVYLPTYGERGVLKSEKLVVGATKENSSSGYTGGQEQNAIAEIRYNAKRQKTWLALGNGTVTQYTYDRETFRLVTLYTKRDARFPDDCVGDPNVAAPARPCGLQNLKYVYDPVGNITHIQDDAQQTIYFRNARVEPTCDYLYDALYRLIEANGREQAGVTGSPPVPESSWPVVAIPTDTTLRRYSERYVYDPVGNFIEIQHIADGGNWTRRYQTAGDSNRLLRTWEGDPSWNSSGATNKVEYRYDSHGNMLNIGATPVDFHLRWDYRDMISGIDLGGSGKAYYQYDASKQRTRKRIVNQNNLGGYWERIYLGGYELYRRYNNGGSNLVEEIESLHLFEGEQRVLLVDDVLIASDNNQPRPDGVTLRAQTLFRYQYSNHLGSACLELDHQAEIISYEEFHPYGTSGYRAMKGGIEAPPKRYRYTGMEKDGETGLAYHSARFYLPWIGRWASCDPIGGHVPNSSYEYAKNNVASNIDTNGMMDEQSVRNAIEDLEKTRASLQRFSAAAQNHELTLLFQDFSAGQDYDEWLETEIATLKAYEEEMRQQSSSGDPELMGKAVWNALVDSTIGLALMLLQPELLASEENMQIYNRIMSVFRDEEFKTETDRRLAEGMSLVCIVSTSIPGLAKSGPRFASFIEKLTTRLTSPISDSGKMAEAIRLLEQEPVTIFKLTPVKQLAPEIYGGQYVTTDPIVLNQRLEKVGGMLDVMDPVGLAPRYGNDPIGNVLVEAETTFGNLQIPTASVDDVPQWRSSLPITPGLTGALPPNKAIAEFTLKNNVLINTQPTRMVLKKK